MLRLLLLLVSIAVCFAKPSADLLTALEQFHESDFIAARESTESIILTGRGDELEAALYLLVRIDLAERDGDAARRGAERLLRAFPHGEYYPYARFTLAQAYFLDNDLDRAKRELQWCADSSTVDVLAARADAVLAEREEFADIEALFPSDAAEARRAALGSEHQPHVVLLLGFPDQHDIAPQQLDDAFVFAAQQLAAFDCEVWYASSAFGTVQALDSAAQNDVDLIVFAGDEGSAMALTLANSERNMPVMKLTSTPRSMASLCETMIELLPSQETMAASAAKYVAMELGVRHGLMLTPDSDLGKAHRDGFGRSEACGLVLDAQLTYPADVANVRRELYDLMSTPARLERGGEMVDALLSRKEREQIFGGSGEVSVQAVTTESSQGGTGSEAFFLSLQTEQINSYCSQLANLPKGMFLVGNSSWLDARALATQAKVTRDMIIVVLCCPKRIAGPSCVLRLKKGTPLNPARGSCSVWMRRSSLRRYSRSSRLMGRHSCKRRATLAIFAAHRYTWKSRQTEKTEWLDS
ncbi:MAG: tetratricopeptide repeat protein [bacterium]|nr:tetratricopeptide repeat protein [bacterium]